MKVLFLSDFFLSGQSTHVLELAKGLQKLGVDVHIAFGTVHSKLFWSYYVPYLNKNNVSFSQMSALPRLVSEAFKWKPDLIHCQSSTLFKTAQSLSARLGLPYILTCHGLGFNQPRYHGIFASAHAIIAIGPKVAKEIDAYAHKIAIIPNGIDTELFCPPNDNLGLRKAILYVGRIEEKRIPALQHLIKANEVISKRPLNIISDWNPNLPGTFFRPWQVDLVPHLQRSGIVVACGRTAREALSCGNVVLLMQQAYDGIVSPQLVAQQDFDFSGNVGRFPFSALQSDLRKLLRWTHRLKKLQSWGRHYATLHLSSEQMVNETAQLYEQVLKVPHPFAKGSLWPPL